MCHPNGLLTGPLLAEALEAALVILRFLSFAGVAHEPERAGGVDLHAKLYAAKERLPGTSMRFAGVERQGAFRDGIRLGQQRAEADDLAAG